MERDLVSFQGCIQDKRYSSSDDEENRQVESVGSSSGIENSTDSNKKGRNFLGKCKPHSYPALLLILIMIPAGCVAGYSRVAAAVLAFTNPCEPGISFRSSMEYTTAAFIIQNSLVYLGFPIAGWLADTRFGQFRMIYASVWCFWSGIFLFGVGCVLRLLEPCEGPVFLAGKYGANISALIFITLGAIAFFPNVLVLLMDQLPDVSNAHLRSYIHWFIWALYLGFFGDNWMESGSQLYTEYIDQWFYIAVLAAFVVFSIVLMILMFYKQKFITSFAKTNPYHTVYKVLAFVKNHKVPVRRSAFTYWENKLPGRIDIAKSKYGGPFSHETVEDVKTLLRILLVYAALFPFFIGYAGPLTELIPFVNHFSPGALPISRLSVYPLHCLVTLIAIPILELVILPLFPKFDFFVANKLRWLLVACVFMLLCNTSLTIIAGVARSEVKDCFIVWNAATDKPHTFPYYWLFIPSFMWSIAEFLMATSILSFICSQSPYNMRGMLLGMFMFMQGLFTEVGIVVTFLFSTFEPVLLSCGFLYWLVMTVASLFGCIVFSFVVQCYQMRVREEVLDERGLIESIYDRELALEAQVAAMFASHDHT